MFAIFESPTYLSFQKRWKRRIYFTSYNLRACLIGWVTVIIVIACTLPFFEIVAFRNALRSVKLRSPSSQHYHEDTTNSGPHDLQGKMSTDMEFFDLPTAGEDMSKLQPLLMQPPNLDSSEERKARKSLLEPPIVDSNEGKRGPDTSTDVDRPGPLKMMDSPNYERVMFVDTPAEERARLIKTHKPPVMSTGKAFTRKEDAVKTTYVMGKEDAEKWKSGHADVKWLDITDRTTVGVSVKPVLADVTSTAAPEQIPSMPAQTFKVVNPQASHKKVNVAIEKTTPRHLQPPPPPVDYGYDENVSYKISVTRDIPDARHETCKTKKYNKLSQHASVIISVYDESWSVLLRTIYSVMKRTPKNLLKELIIVDDHSNNQLTFMWEKLKLEIKKWSNIHVYRNQKREGLIRSRMFGAAKATGNILVFLDSHVEVNKGWLEPLMERIAKNWQVVAVPVLDSISPQNFQYEAEPQIPNTVDAFRWDLHAYKIHGPKAPKEDPTGAIPSPITGHGQFAVSKLFFESLGGFDKHLDTYGGEFMEMSLKAWMCGGRVEIIPCSRVGHVGRGRLPSLRNENTDKLIQRNLKRVAMTWLDEHSVYFENSMNSSKRLEYGDITDRIELRKKLRCKSFEWYLKNVYPQLYDPKESAIADSEIRSTGMDGTLCLDVFSTAHGVANMFPCHGDGGNQRFWYTKKGEIRRYDMCLDYWGKKVQFLPCHGLQGNQLWLYITGINKIKHVNANRCLTVVSHDTVDVLDCEDGAMNQQWSLNNFNMTAYEDAGME